MANPITIIRRKKALLRWAKSRHVAIPKHYNALAPRMGRSAKALLRTFQMKHPPLSVTGLWNKPTIKLIEKWYPKPSLRERAADEAMKHRGQTESNNTMPNFLVPFWGYRIGWCTVFASYCYWKAGSRTFRKGYSQWSGQLMEDARHHRNGLSFVASPSRGDIGIISFGETSHSHIYGDHTVICLKDNGNSIHTIEGNTSAANYGSQSHGGMVAEKDRSRSLFIGFIRVSR
jgi:hypothetical protein